MEVAIRTEQAADRGRIHGVHARSFPTDAEARLVSSLRANGALLLSLVAVVDGEVVGHIAFSRVTVESSEHIAHGVGLAPMAVTPGYRGQGIGGLLIRAGLDQLRRDGEPFCVVLGHASYYPRHGFERASTRGLRWERPAPEASFFVQELAPGGLQGVSGIVRYRRELDEL